MKKLLEKISWVTRKWNIKFELFTLRLHDGDNAWGFRLFTLTINYVEYSLLALEFRLPNKTNVIEFTIDDWDFLFLRYFLWRRLDTLSEGIMWKGENELITRWEKMQLIILNKIFK